jgi:hypothetical protein
MGAFFALPVGFYIYSKYFINPSNGNGFGGGYSSETEITKNNSMNINNTKNNILTVNFKKDWLVKLQSKVKESNILITQDEVDCFLFFNKMYCFFNCRLKYNTSLGSVCWDHYSDDIKKVFYSFYKEKNIFEEIETKYKGFSKNINFIKKFFK